MAKNRISLSSAVEGCSSMNLGQKLCTLLVCSLLSGLVAVDVGGVIFVCIAAGILAYTMCTGTSVFVLPLCGAISLGFGLLLGAKLPGALITLLYVPMAIIIWLSIRGKRSLSQTVLFLTILLVSVLGATVGIMFLLDYNGMMEFFTSLYNAYTDYITANINQLYSESNGIAQNYVDSFISSIIMLTPGTIVVLLMIISYFSAKVCRVASIINASNEMFESRRWPVTASLTHTVLCTVTTLVAITASNPVVAYSASNLMLLLIPASTVFGLNLMFGRNRRRRPGFMGRLPIILICIVSFYTGGAPLIIFASFYALVHNIKEFLHTKLKKED